MAMMKQMADKSVVLKYTFGSDDDQDDDDEEEVQQSIDVDSSTPSAICTANAEMSKFTEMSRQFAEMMEQRKLQLMARKKSVRTDCLSKHHLRRKLENCQLHTR
jgi:hypothetical protein